MKRKKTGLQRRECSEIRSESLPDLAQDHTGIRSAKEEQRDVIRGWEETETGSHNGVPWSHSIRNLGRKLKVTQVRVDIQGKGENREKRGCFTEKY